jgi:Co/Zn/Cd efflux system component
MFIGLLVNHACAWVLLGGDPKLRIHAARTAFLPNVLQSRRTDSACQCLTS